MPGMNGSLACLVAFVLLLAPLAPAAELSARPLKRGINLSHWYAQWSNFDEARLATYLTEEDVKRIAQMGFDHVRLTLNDTVVFTSTPGVLNSANVERLKQRIQQFIDADLAVIVDLQPEDPFKKALHENPKAVDKFVADWGALAGALKSFDPKMLLLEVINEPYPCEGAYWRATQKRLIDAIRAAAPQHTIIASPGGWTGPDAFDGFVPYDTPNVLYTFHFYDPHVYTHQGAEWGWVIARRVKHLDWPIEPGRGAAVARRTAEDEEARQHVKWIVDQGDLSEAWLNARIAKVAAWQKRHGNPPVYAGEFGVYKKVAPEASRLRWLKAVRVACESHGFGWAIWDYAGGFSVLKDDVPGRRTPDEAVLKALGLRE